MKSRIIWRPIFTSKRIHTEKSYCYLLNLGNSLSSFFGFLYIMCKSLLIGPFFAIEVLYFMGKYVCVQYIDVVHSLLYTHLAIVTDLLVLGSKCALSINSEALMWLTNLYFARRSSSWRWRPRGLRSRSRKPQEQGRRRNIRRRRDARDKSSWLPLRRRESSKKTRNKSDQTLSLIIYLAEITQMTRVWKW